MKNVLFAYYLCILRQHDGAVVSTVAFETLALEIACSPRASVGFLKYSQLPPTVRAWVRLISNSKMTVDVKVSVICLSVLALSCTHNLSRLFSAFCPTTNSELDKSKKIKQKYIQIKHVSSVCF